MLINATYRANNVCTQHPVGLFISDDLDETVGVVVCLCSAVGNEWEFANNVVDAFLLQILFALTNPGNLNKRISKIIAA